MYELANSNDGDARFYLYDCERPKTSPGALACTLREGLFVTFTVLFKGATHSRHIFCEYFTSIHQRPKLALEVQQYRQVVVGTPCSFFVKTQFLSLVPHTVYLFSIAVHCDAVPATKFLIVFVSLCTAQILFHSLCFLQILVYSVSHCEEGAC